MLQHAVALLLQRLLGKFVSFDSSMLRLSLWQGDLSFQDLQLRLSYGEGSIRELSVKIPWRALWTQAVVIRASGIRILLHQTAQAPATALDSLAASLSGSQDVEGVADDESAVDQSDGPTDRTYLSRLVSHIIANVQIELEDVQVRYDCAADASHKSTNSASLEVSTISLINTNASWELEYTPQSNAIMESRKLLRTEGIRAYIETSSNEPAARERHYLLHDWYTSVKATLCYHSSNATFPDVELAVDVGSREGSQSQVECEFCTHAHRDPLVETALPVSSISPRVHLTACHVDVLYAILMEVKAPYEEFERLSELTEKQASRPEGFVMVLSFARCIYESSVTM
ncbi:hypothetical protein P43SY_008840 [Pythium insidiosum]|uniref:Autophagy-related protein 2 n=1 Tax=Pythium insidiosum TaxID=114742 RepID=A0AAD5Q966_PYTIN|nr:hypothetical protein P43SY_008840 [Pythium insidiosum]